MFKRKDVSVASQEFEIGYAELMESLPDTALINFYARHDLRIEQISAASPQTKACSKECAYCCHFKVITDAIEVFAMVDYVKSKSDQQQIDQILQSTKQNIEQARNLSHEEQATINQKCPLLIDNICAVYPVRSIKCRNYHSIDKNSCRASYENPKDLTILNDNIKELYVTVTGSSNGFLESLHAHGYDDRIYDHNAAFIEAFENPDCKRQYLAGKRAFKTAKYNNA